MKKEISTRNRVVFLGIIMTILFLMLTARLTYIQVIMGRTYAKKAVEQRLIPISISRIRGDILDRNGIPLTKGKQKSYFIVFPSFYDDLKALYQIIGSMTGLSYNDFSATFKKSHPYVKLEILNPNLELEKDIEKGTYPGLMIMRQNERYDNSSIARHLIGYLKRSDNTPQSGLEKAFDKYLNSKGEEIVYAIADAKNRVLPGLAYKRQRLYEPYYNVQLTLDYYFQEILEKAMDKYSERSGGVIVDVDTADILAVASRPNFDQNNIEESTNKKDSLWAVPMKSFAPGSLFKTVVAATGLEKGLISRDTEYSCSGEITVNGAIYRCHPSIGGLGDLNMQQAFAYSCNDAFIDLAIQVGGQSIIEMAQKLGIGQSLNIGLDNDKGSLPSKSEYAGAGIGNLALGQGKVEVSPLQVAQMMTIIANGGIRKDISLIKGIIDQSGQMVKDMSKEQRGWQVLDPSTAYELRSWMADVTEYGTATNANSDYVGGTAGKTGTPQINGDTDAEYYGWFAGFFPRPNPEYVIVILVRQETNGGDKPAKIFKEVAEGITHYIENLEQP